jgi:hypothetical protein
LVPSAKNTIFECKTPSIAPGQLVLGWNRQGLMEWGVAKSS